MEIAGVIILIILVVVAYLGWQFFLRGKPLVLVREASTKRVTGSLARIVPESELVIEVNNDAAKNTITNITVLRELASRLGLSAPQGFKEEALLLTEEEKKEKASVDFAKKFNWENLRWVGEMKLLPNEKTEIAIPAERTKGLSDYIDFQYESKSGLGGSISFFRVNLDLEEE